MSMVPPPSPGGPPDPSGLPRPAWQRLLPHLVWEAVLAFVVLAVVVVAVARMSIFDGPAVWWHVASIGLVATALALSLRTGTPNLAVPAFAGLAAMVMAGVTEAGGSALPAAVLALLLVGLFGAVLAVVTWLISAPAWAVSLGGLGLGYALTMLVSGGAPMRVVASPPSPGLGVVWFGLFVVLSVGGGLLFLVPAVQRLLGGGTRNTEAALAPARLVRVLVGFTGSSLLAGLAGLVISSRTLVAMPGVDISLLVTAFGAAVLGGVSVVGGRGGVAGTVLGATLLGVIAVWLQLEQLASPGLSLLIGASAIIGGLVVSRILALFTPAETAVPEVAEVRGPVDPRSSPAGAPAPPPPDRIG